jgi:hypothetical protein
LQRKHFRSWRPLSGSGTRELTAHNHGGFKRRRLAALDLTDLRAAPAMSGKRDSDNNDQGPTIAATALQSYGRSGSSQKSGHLPVERQ